MRISTSQLYSNHQRAVNDRMGDLVRLQRQVTTGKKFDRLSDDPIAGAQLLKAKSVKAAIEQYDKNLQYANNYLKSSENALNEIHSILQNGYEMAVRGANGTLDQTSRQGLANQVGIMQKRLTELANSRGPDGQYIFAGQINDATPYTVSGTTLAYNGDTNPILIETGPGELLQANVDGGQAFVDAYNALESLRTHLLGGNSGDMSGIDIPALQDQLKEFNVTRGEVGATMLRVQELGDSNQRRMDDLTSNISDIEDIDIAEVVTQMRQAEVAYQAALEVSSRSFGMSLMDYLK